MIYTFLSVKLLRLLSFLILVNTGNFSFSVLAIIVAAKAFPTTFKAVLPAFAKKSMDTSKATASDGKPNWFAVARSTTMAPDGTVAIVLVIKVRKTTKTTKSEIVNEASYILIIKEMAKDT